jgi:hypothetical protein
MPATPWDIFGTDIDLENEGAWNEKLSPDFKFKIRSTGSEEYKRVLKVVFKRYDRQVTMGTMEDSVARNKLYEVFAKSIVIDWWCSEFGDHKMWGSKGECLDFSVENVKQLFKDIPKLFDAVQEEAQAADNFRHKEEDEAVGNSPTSSSTTSAQGDTQKKSSPQPAKGA